MLFNKRLLQIHLNNFDYPANYDYAKAQHTISLWQESIKNGNYDKTNETKVQASFLTRFFNNILGYSEMQDNPNEWFLVNEAKTEIDGTKADGALGYFTKEHNNDIVRAVIELKDANTPLDKKQSSRKDYDSPVSQAFSYSSKFDRCDWIIVSNFKEIRLYNKERGQGYYETFEVLNLDDENEFKRFYFCLCKLNLLDKNRNSLLDNLVKDTSKNEEEITKDFYKDFRNLRESLFEHICANNPEIDKKCILEKTQKLLDRLVFVMFCEDSSIGLLPPYTIRDYYNLRERIPSNSDEKVWQLYRDLFHSIDEGNSSVNPPINRYNGGLFAKDEILDNLVIKDMAWADVVKLSEYDFESDLNVNILGHIFEQSLNDIEQIKAKIDKIEQDNKKSKRKKDGIFYTPEYITRYIVEQTIGKYLEENPDKLETIKILDPACGSGAFLNQAHTFLQQQYKIRTEERINAARISETLNLFEHSNIADTNRSILLNNLYGVDLNSESTEITKLALWLKTAHKDQPLQNLDKNIKCGNSLIDDSNVAGDKAFNWNEEYKDIMSNGGFDIIIGNPPYGAELDEQSKNYIYKNYNSVEYQIDTYVVFIERALKLLKEGGKLSFIVPSTWLNMHYFSKLRNLIISDTKLEQVILYRYQVFEDVTAETCIFVCSKTHNKDNKVRISYIDKLEQNNNIEYSNISQDYWKENYENGFNVFYNQEKISIIKKIFNNCNLAQYVDIKNGIKPYEVGKGKPKQTKEMVQNRVYDSMTKFDQQYKQYIVGSNISKYYISTPKTWFLY
ncbi:N-6 DNA methylase, partial [bacterium]|nr:N-6 DNA methylase [bacterium]